MPFSKSIGLKNVLSVNATLVVEFTHRHRLGIDPALQGVFRIGQYQTSEPFERDTANSLVSPFVHGTTMRLVFPPLEFGLILAFCLTLSIHFRGLIHSLLLVASSGSLTYLWHFSWLLPNDNAIIINNFGQIYASSLVVLVDKQAARLMASK